MKTQEVQFNGITYTCRVVESNEGEELLIGSTVLLDDIHPGSFEDENEGFASKEAEQLYNKIFFFTDKVSFNDTYARFHVVGCHGVYCHRIQRPAGIAA